MEFLSRLDTRTQPVYHYDGSLTTPPCSEVVSFVLVGEVQNLSQRQAEAFNDLWASDVTFAGGRGNNRQIMPLNGRRVYTTKKMEAIAKL
jgi:carbonic anhydrase